MLRRVVVHCAYFRLLLNRIWAGDELLDSQQVISTLDQNAAYYRLPTEIGLTTFPTRTTFLYQC